MTIRCTGCRDKDKAQLPDGQPSSKAPPPGTCGTINAQEWADFIDGWRAFPLLYLRRDIYVLLDLRKGALCIDFASVTDPH